MTDRELLEFAAKAAGIDLEWDPAGWARDTKKLYFEWNPLGSDGDALRLAVTLRMSIVLRPLRVEVLSWPTQKAPIFHGFGGCLTPQVETMEPYEDDPAAATRRAIVRAAAKMGGVCNGH